MDMKKRIEYFFTPGSPWSYLGHDRLHALAKEHDATLELKPIDLGKVFPISGGLPLPKRAPQRQAYRLVELARWRDFLGVPLNLQPKFGGVSTDLASRWILAAAASDADSAMRLASAIMLARWAEERDVSDEATLRSLARDVGLDPEAVATGAAQPAVAAQFDALTQEAIDRQVFGAPTYVYQEEPFWGQDRLDFLARKLAK
jgi:2-hydroxychromene-2-carboxylate isomerase